MGLDIGQERKDKCGSDPCQLFRHILRTYGTGSQASMSCLQGWQVPRAPPAFHKVALSDAWRDTVAVCGFSPPILGGSCFPDMSYLSSRQMEVGRSLPKMDTGD